MVRNPEHPLRMSSSAMWITGFDAQSISTVYLDKPMRGLTLYKLLLELTAYLLVNLTDLCRLHWRISRLAESTVVYMDKGTDGEMPVHFEKSELIAELNVVLADLDTYIMEVSSHSLDDVEHQQGFERVAVIERLVDAVVSTQSERKFGSLAYSHSTSY